MTIPVRIVELQFFDFNDFEGLPAAPRGIDMRVFKAGELRSNGRTLQSKTAVTFSRQYPDDAAFDLIVSDFLSCMGGADAVKAAADRVKPVEAFLRLHVPVKSSERIQDDSLGRDVLALLRTAGLALDFWFT